MPAGLIENEPQTPLDQILPATKTLAMTEKVTTDEALYHAKSG